MKLLKASLFTMLFFGMGYPFLTAYAAESVHKGHSEAKKSSKEVNVKVNGMVCSFCTSKLEKSFKEKSEVSQVHVNLDSKNIHVVFAENKNLSDDEIKKIVTDAGYTVVKLER